MKDIISSVVLGIFVLTLSYCSKDKESSTNACDDLYISYSTALNEHMSNPSVKTCETLVSTYRSILDQCSLYLTEQQKQDYEDALNNFNCSE